jgi:hypothetical protein
MPGVIARRTHGRGIAKGRAIGQNREHEAPTNNLGGFARKLWLGGMCGSDSPHRGTRKLFDGVVGEKS